MVSGAGPSGGAAHSASTGGGGGSPSDRGGAAPSASASVSTPASESTVARRLNGLDLQGDDAPSLKPAASKKKKRGTHAVGPDKNGRGLRQFSMRVCEKVESKGRTTYNEVADELVAEFSDPNINIDSPDPDNPSAQQYDEKNIRRRVYDALNVLMAMEIISKDKKEIQWRGLPKTSMNDIEELKTEVIGLEGRIDKKTAYLQDLQDQYACLQNLVRRNEQLYGSGDAPSGGVALPFILVKTRPHATVEVEISEDMQLVHFDFNSTPFELQDDTFVLKAMGLSGKEENDCTQAPVVNGARTLWLILIHTTASLTPLYAVRLRSRSQDAPVRAARRHRPCLSSSHLLAAPPLELRALARTRASHRGCTPSTCRDQWRGPCRRRAPRTSDLRALRGIELWAGVELHNNELHSSNQQGDIALALKASVARVCFNCFRYFRGILQVFYTDVAKQQK